MAETIKAKCLQPGSTIAIIAPAGPPRADRLRKGLDFLRRRGYKLKVFPQIKLKTGYLAGSDQERAEALMDAFSNKAIDGIFAARGGYGCLRLLPYIDFSIVKRNPKVLVGYSDLTVLLLSIYKKCGFVTFHGPMTAVEFGRRLRDYTVRHFFNALENPTPMGIIKRPAGYNLSAINGGAATGVIIGGNLSLIARMAGTGFLPSFERKIVFLEDTEEEPYRLDAYLAQLFMATDLAKASGFILGEFTRTEPRYGHTNSWSTKQVLNDYFSELKQPVLSGFPCGHGKEKITIPIGVRATLDADKKSVTFLESGVRL
jgi:muramoyltetrapeptide carboxypeptidase